MHPEHIEADRRPARTLDQLEDVVRHGLGTFVDVGRALFEIRDRRLFERLGFATFDAYCRDRWGWQRARSDQLIRAAEIVRSLDTTVSGPLPTSEYQARELARIQDPDERAAVWREVTAPGAPPPTVGRIREAVGRRAPMFEDWPPPEPLEPHAAWSDRERMLWDQVRSGMTVVINFRTDIYLVAAARSAGLLVRVDRESDWGNPFELPADGDRETVVANYERHYLPHKPSLLRRRAELRGKALACWCAPERCHGDVLKALADQSDGEEGA